MSLGRPQLVASDLDGTLLSPDMVFPDGLAEGLAALREAGITFVVSTGRMFQSVQKAVRPIGLRDGPIVCYQGAMVADLADGRVLAHTPVPADVAADVVRYAHQLGRHINAYIDDRFTTDQDDEWARFYADYGKIECHLVPDLEAAVRQSASTKLLILADPEDVERLLPVFRERYGRELFVVRSQPQFLELTSARVSKSSALTYVCDLLGVDARATVACGDADNDLDMLRWAGTSVAVAEGNKTVRAAADVVVPRARLGDYFRELAGR